MDLPLILRQILTLHTLYILLGQPSHGLRAQSLATALPRKKYKLLK